jgi:hypothetical protein
MPLTRRKRPGDDCRGGTFSEKYASSSEEDEDDDDEVPANNPISTADDVDAARMWLRFRLSVPA